MNKLFEGIIEENKLFIDEDMSNRVSFKAGGKARLLVEVDTFDQIKGCIQTCKKNNIIYIILGNGSNILFRDDTFDGVVIAITKHDLEKDFFDTRVSGNNSVTVGAGVKLSSFSKFLLDHSLQGFEFAAGIPGSIGGAVFMNAGAYGGEICDIIKSVRVYSPDNDSEMVIDKEELQLSYRHSRFMDTNEVILEATFEFKPGNAIEILEKIKDLNRKRLLKQPLEYPSAGSFFKRPEGYFAGKLLEDAGLRGFSIGGAQVSEKHCGFVVNKGNATATDIIKLMEHCQSVVFDKFGVKIEPEPRII